MAQNAATIITAALDDSQLRRSIDKLISAVETGTATMARSFDNAISTMSNSLSRLNTASGQAASASERRSRQNQQEEQSVTSLANAYDRLRVASDNLRGRANLRYNTDDELLNLRTQENWLKSKLRKHEGGSLYSPITEADIQRARTLTDQITELQRRIRITQRDMERGLIPQDSGRTQIGQLNSYIDNLKRQITQITGGKSVESLERWNRELTQIQARIQDIGQRMQFVHDQQQQAIRDAAAQAQAQRQAEEAQRRAAEQARQQAEADRQRQRQWRELRRQTNAQVAGAMSMGEGNEQQILAKLQAIKRLRDQLQNSGILSQSRVNQMNNAIDKLERKLAKINAQIAKIRQKREPLSTNGVLGMSESTLDNIAAKMRAISELRGRLSIARQSGEIKVLNQEYKRLAETQSMLLNRQNRLITANKLLGNSFNYIRNRLIYAVSIGALSGFVRQLIEVRGQYELLERGIGVLVNSYTKGSEIFNQLSSMALKSPFTLVELAGSAKQLSAYNFQASEIVDTTRRLADISAALGVPMERLVYNLGQIRAQTVLTARDARDFANAGLPIINTLAQYYSKLEGRVVSTGDVYDRMSKKMVSYADVMSVINEMTDDGGKFFDYQAKTADTLRVQVANLTLAWNNMLNEIGESNQGVMSGFIGIAKSAFIHWRGISQVITDVVVAFGVLKGAMITYATFVNSGTRALTTNLAVEKAAIVAKLQKKKALVGLTKAEKAQLAAAKKTTAADYQAALASETYRKSQLKSLIARNQNNVALITAIRNTKLLKEEEIQAAMNAGRMGRAWMQFRASVGGIGNVLGGILSPQNIIMGGVMLGMQAYQTHQQNLEDLRNFRQSMIDSAKENRESIDKFLSDYRDSIQRVTQGGASDKEAVDMWVAIKEQIENSTTAANQYLNILSGVDDYSSRVAQGVNVLKDAAEAARVMSYYANTIDFTQGFDFLEEAKRSMRSGDALINMMPIIGPAHAAYQATQIDWEGLNDDAKDYNERLREIQEVTQQYNISLEYTVSIMDRLNSASQRQEALMKAGYSEDVASKLAEAYSGGSLEASLKTQREEVLREIDATIADFIPKLNQMGNLSKNQLFEVVARYEDEIVKANGNIEGETRNMFHRALVEALPAQYAEYKQELEAYTEEMRKFFDYIYSQNKDAFEGLTREEIEQIDWSTGQYKDIMDNALRYLEKNTVPETYNAIVKMVNDANNLSIVIPVLLNVIESRQGTMDTDFQREYDTIMGNVRSDFGNGYKFMPKAYRPKANENTLTFAKRIHDDLTSVTKTYKEQERNLHQIATAMGKDSAAYKSAFNEYQGTANQLATLTGISSIYPWMDEEKKKKAGGGRRGGGGRGAKPEDEVANAIKKALQVLHEVRSNYEKLAKAGVKDKDAIEVAASGYEETIKAINAVLTKFGVAEFDTSKFAGKDITDVKKMLEDMLQSLVASGKVKLESLKDLDVEISKVTVEAKEFDMSQVAESINNELNKLKNEYEIAMEIDANPELGEMFNEMMGIDASAFPKTMSDVVGRAQSAVSKKLKEKGFGDFDIMGGNLESWASEQGVKKDSKLYNEIANTQKYAQDLFKKRLQETEKALDDYVKKYGRYSDKIAEIEAARLKKIKDLNDAYSKQEMKERPEYLAKLNAINRGAQREASNVAFEHFKEDGLYTQLFEDLDHASDATLKILRQRIEGIRDSSKEFKPDQLKAFNEQLDKLDKQAIKRNPFTSFGRDIKTYVANIKKWKDTERELLDVQDKIDKHEGKLTGLMKERERMKSEGDTSSGAYEQNEADIKHYQHLLELEEERKKALEKELELRQKIGVHVSEEVQAIIQITNDYVNSAAELRDMAKEIFGLEVPELDGFIDGLQRASKGVDSIVKSAMGGNFMGVIAGTGNFLYGIWDGIASIFGGGSAKNRKIDKQIEKSARTVKRLENAYKDLERAVEHSLGTNETLARRAAIANKRLQLAETERQLQLERSRSKKKQDQDKIIDLEGQVKDLRNEIKDMTSDVANNLLGSDLKDAAENFVSTFINAWKQGENTLDALKESFNDTIETMITKSLASAIVASRLRKIYDMVDEFTSEKSDSGVGLSFAELQTLRNTMQEGGGIVEGINQDLTNLFSMLGLNGLQGVGGTGGLSALQQGIQGITEDQAGALEAYWNASVQQSYLHSTLLTEIRDMLTVGNFELSNATQAQMLLQMQQSYQVQMAINMILQGWSNPSGSAVRVQMI